MPVTLGMHNSLTALSLPLETGSPALDELMEHLGEKVKMKGFSKYRAQLDNKSKWCTIGVHRLYS